MALNMESLPTAEDFTLSPDEIRKLRSRFGMSREKFSKFLNMGFATIWQWETGRTKPSPLALEKLAGLITQIQSKRIDKDF